MAEALYRKYRPQVFEDVVGQEPIERTLKNAISQDKVSHAYLFCGPRGTGKTTTARLLAKALMCEGGPTPDPDGTCEDCQLIAEGAHPDVYELDAASRTGVDNVREEIISRVHFAPTRGRYKVYIIDEVHMLSMAAFNALLKTLEEPPGHVVFILCTTDPQKVPETIHSRCQRFDFRRIAPESMVSRLGAICMAEDVEFEGEALDLIAQRAEGGLRNALTSLEQIIAFENGKVTLSGAERLLGSIDSNELAEVMALIGRRDIAGCFKWTASFVETGADFASFTRDMAEHVRNLYIMALVGDDADLDVSETSRRELAGELAWFGPERAARLLGVLGDLMSELKTTSNPRLAFEIALTRMVRPDSDLTIAALAERVEALESGYSAVAHVLPGPIGSAAVLGDNADRGQRAGERVGAAPAPASEQLPSGAEGVPAFGVASEDRVDVAPESQAPSQPQAHDVGWDLPAAQPEAAPAASSAQRPEEVPIASAVSSKLSSLGNPASLQRIWQAALSDVKKRKQAYGVLFMNTKASFDEAAGMLRVQFPRESTFAFGAVQKPDVQDVLADALAKAVGEPVNFCYTQGDAAPASAVVAAPTAAQSPDPPQPQQPQAQSRDRVQPQPQQEVEREPQTRSHAQPQPQAELRQPLQTPAEQPQMARVVDAGDSYDQVPYEDMPYDEASYDEVPFEAYSASYSAPAPSEPATGAAFAPASQVQPDVVTGPSPAAPDPASESVVEEDPAAMQALLQASFGDGVKFSEE